MGCSHLSDEEMMELVNDISNDVPHKDISEKYNVTLSDIRNISKINGIIDVRRKERLKQNKRVIELYKEGYNFAEIGRVVGYDRKSVAHILDRLGVQRKHGKRNIDVVKRNIEIAKLYRSGNYTRQELADKFDLSYNYICQIISLTLHISSDKYLYIKDTKINDMINEGKTNTEIRQGLNVLKTTLSPMFYKQNYQDKNKERNDKIFELYQTGNYKQIKLCEMFNLSRGQISKIILKYENINKKERDTKIFELYQTGDYTQTELGDMFNLTTRAISYIIKKYKNNVK